MRFGPKCERGFLPVYSVADEREAEDLLLAACGRNLDGEFVAKELAAHQTLDNLKAFSDRLHAVHAHLRERGKCRCVAPEPHTP